MLHVCDWLCVWVCRKRMIPLTIFIMTEICRLWRHVGLLWAYKFILEQGAEKAFWHRGVMVVSMSMCVPVLNFFSLGNHSNVFPHSKKFKVKMYTQNPNRGFSAWPSASTSIRSTLRWWLRVLNKLGVLPQSFSWPGEVHCKAAVLPKEPRVYTGEVEIVRWVKTASNLRDKRFNLAVAMLVEKTWTVVRFCSQFPVLDA